MKRTVTALALMGVVSLIAGPAVGQGEPEYWVYFSNADTVYRFDPATCVDNVACIQTVLVVPGAELRGLNFGPDENLYWCDSENGRVGRVNPSTADEEVFFTFAGSGPAELTSRPNSPGPGQTT